MVTPVLIIIHLPHLAKPDLRRIPRPRVAVPARIQPKHSAVEAHGDIARRELMNVRHVLVLFVEAVSKPVSSGLYASMKRQAIRDRGEVDRELLDLWYCMSD